jgi:hypothetical protein
MFHRALRSACCLTIRHVIVGGELRDRQRDALGAACTCKLAIRESWANSCMHGNPSAKVRQREVVLTVAAVPGSDDAVQCHIIDYGKK